MGLALLPALVVGQVAQPGIVDAGQGVEGLVQRAPPAALDVGDRGPRRVLEPRDRHLGVGVHDVDEAVDGAEGLRSFGKRPSDLVLTDINMPVMDGLKLVSLVRQDDTHKNIPVVIITTEGAHADRERAMTLGANAYITKPIQAAQVVDCVRRLLNQ